MRHLCALMIALTVASRASADTHADAKAHFERGLALVDAKDWEHALGEFMRSRELEPTRTATKNAAMCLGELHRFDEALALYEALLRDYATVLTAADRATLQTDVHAIERFVGELAITGPAGSTVSIDGRARGTLPLTESLRVSVGTRIMRVEHEGFQPRSESVVVLSGERRSIAVTLDPIAQRGTLRVREASGRALDVRVDSAVVGRTPWEGVVSSGEHAVSLHGAGDIGATALAVVIATNETREVTLAASMLPGNLRIEPTPPNATVSIDGRITVEGTFDGDLPSGEHTVEVTSPWYVAHRERVVVSSREPHTIRVVLAPVSRAYVEGILGFILLPTYATSATCGTLDPNCLGWIVAMRGGYAITERFAAELAYYAYVEIRRYDASANAGVFLSGGIVSAAYRLFDRVPITLRLGAGASRESAAGEGYTPLVVPEIAVGWRVAERVRVDFALSALLFVLQSGSQAYQGGVGAAFPLTIALHGDL